MLNENAKKWVAALRSGKYKQGRSYLKMVDKGETRYCCLGIACEVAIENGLNLLVEPKHSDGMVMCFDKHDDYLPTRVQDWLGLASQDGTITVGHSLIDHNDENCKTFEQIADIIESEPTGLFKDIQ